VLDDIDLSDGCSSESSDFTEFEDEAMKGKSHAKSQRNTDKILEDVDDGNENRQ